MNYYQARNLKYAFYFSAYVMLFVQDWYLAVALMFFHGGVIFEAKLQAAITFASLLIQSRKDNENE